MLQNTRVDKNSSGGDTEGTYYVVKYGGIKMRKLLVTLMCVVMAVAATGAVVFRKREN